MSPLPPPVIEVRIDPKTESDRGALTAALTEMAAKDPLLRTTFDDSSEQAILMGMSELHLDLAIETLRRVHEINISIGAPQIAYREFLSRPCTVEHTYNKRAGARSGYARVKVALAPLPSGQGCEFAIAPDVAGLPGDHVKAIAIGVANALKSGTLAGFPVTDLATTIIDAAYHESDSSVEAFEIAAQAATHEGLRGGGCVLIEPIMTLDIRAPAALTAAIIGDLKSRRGEIDASAPVGDTVAITALVPLATLFGYTNTLGWLSHGRASFKMEFRGYAVVPSATDDHPPAAPAMAMRAG